MVAHHFVNVPSSHIDILGKNWIFCFCVVFGVVSYQTMCELEHGAGGVGEPSLYLAVGIVVSRGGPVDH